MSFSTLSKQLFRPDGGMLKLMTRGDLHSARSLTTKNLTPTIAFMTNSDTKIGSVGGKPKQWQYASEGRPLSVLLCWLMAKNNAVNKYANFYLEKGFDVMTVRITPTQLLLPTKTNRIVETELLPLLASSDHPKSIVHGFSVGGYVFAQMLRIAHEQPEYNPVIAKMVGQIWDSVVDVQGTAIGVSKSVFPNSRLAQKLLKDYIDAHMKLMYGVSTKHYYQAHDYFYDRPLKAPALFLNSFNDPISPMDVIQGLQQVWIRGGLKVSTKAWENTPHVGHMQRHPDEYKKAVNQFLSNIGIRPERVVDSLKEPAFVPNLVVS